MKRSSNNSLFWWVLCFLGGCWVILQLSEVSKLSGDLPAELSAGSPKGQADSPARLPIAISKLSPDGVPDRSQTPNLDEILDGNYDPNVIEKSPLPILTQADLELLGQLPRVCITDLPPLDTSHDTSHEGQFSSPLYQPTTSLIQTEVDQDELINAIRLTHFDSFEKNRGVEEQPPAFAKQIPSEFESATVQQVSFPTKGGGVLSAPALKTGTDLTGSEGVDPHWELYSRNPYPFELPFSVGLVPLMFQNGVWFEDAV